MTREPEQTNQPTANQFDLKSLLVGTLVIALLFGFFRLRGQRHEEINKIAGAFRARGANVNCSPASFSESMANLFWIGGRGSITRLTWRDKPLTDSQLARCDDLLSRLSNLRALDLSGTKVTDQSLKIVASLSQLERLDLSDTLVTDSGLARLGGLVNLTSLNLTKTKISDEALDTAGQFQALLALYLGQTEVSDAGLETLTVLPKLRFLDLNHTSVSDAGMGTLGSIATLQTLDLRGTKITDAGLVQLSGLPILSLLTLEETEVTLEAARVMAEKLPSFRNLTVDDEDGICVLTETGDFVVKSRYQ